jgi:hypothetical protein
MIAIEAVTSVPRTYGKTPKPAAASQLVPERKLKPNFVNAGKAPLPNTNIESPIMPMTDAAKTSEPYRKNPSEEGCFKPSNNFWRFSRSDTYLLSPRRFRFRRT